MKFTHCLVSLAALSASSLAPAAAYTVAEVAAESAKANAFFERVFDEVVARSPMTMTQLGLKTDYDKWDDFSEQGSLENLQLAITQLAEMKRTINFAALDDQARVSYRMFALQTEEAIEGWRWRHHSYPLNQMDGAHSLVPAFLISFHSVENLAEAQAYVARLRGIAPLFAETVASVKARAALGVLPPKFVFPIVIDACRSVITGAPFEQTEKKSALWEDFESKVNALTNVDAAVKTALLAEAHAALLESVQPAYASLIALLTEQEAVATTDDGVWKLPAGDEYYAFKLRESTTTNLTAAEIHQIGLREVARIHAEMTAIKEQVGFKGTLPEFFVFMREDPQFYYPNTPEGKQAYIDRANGFIAAMSAELDRFFGVKPKAPLVLRKVEPFREEGSAAAFYEQPSPDGSRPGVYYVNTFDMNGLPIYEMESLAYHEAIPGHHMQIAIA
ncbi:MAG: DUF885 domain-containing protein, partial [Candidatus Didemnitutus sp.]|nr:DUF885 domain-containing protein [Candidatus Didemnitutus sp.]